MVTAGLPTFLTLLFLLLVVHALADYPLQGDFLARAKNHRQPIPGVPWWQALAAHSMIHAGGVWLVTGSILLGLAELVSHAVIDWMKSGGGLTFTQDQALHVWFKACWAAFAVSGVVPW